MQRLIPNKQGSDFAFSKGDTGGGALVNAVPVGEPMVGEYLKLTSSEYFRTLAQQGQYKANAFVISDSAYLPAAPFFAIQFYMMQ
jgi:hypothetical protein